MSKNELRAKYKALRSKLENDQIDDLSLDISNHLLQLDIWEKSFYHIFLSIQKQKELNTEFILHILQGKDKNIVVSKSNFKDNSLEHMLLTDNTVLKVNDWGIPEPVDGIPIPESKIDVVFVPLLAFDQLGNRVGYGKGFYDKFLSKCNPETIKIGLSFFSAEELIENVLPTDIALDFCVTPQKIYDFNKK
ncbi:5-formyltetrahydrofolate cyclo-ligase [uncultured Aquimarina sp.]|uniref:5-formyltetrahydrofolate cyclo-ligase n=1 Tax=uncultured Aquimarina sp. TaxID=575652 RepID=UPI00262AD820|nr:5-formyltetrahydrofolate cyclo-ligase [uncultured Aquimarina sp.]